MKISLWSSLAISILLSIIYFGFPSQLGRSWAKFDLWRGHYEVRGYGLPHGAGHCGELLESYGIRLRWVAGCVVDNSIIASSNAYNCVMYEAIYEDLGVNVSKFLWPCNPSIFLPAATDHVSK